MEQWVSSVLHGLLHGDSLVSGHLDSCCARCSISTPRSEHHLVAGSGSGALIVNTSWNRCPQGQLMAFSQASRRLASLCCCDPVSLSGLQACSTAEPGCSGHSPGGTSCACPRSDITGLPLPVSWLVCREAPLIFTVLRQRILDDLHCLRDTVLGRGWFCPWEGNKLVSSRCCLLPARELRCRGCSGGGGGCPPAPAPHIPSVSFKRCLFLRLCPNEN